jgi:hypothetical protein
VLPYADYCDPFGQSSDCFQCRHEPPHQSCPAHALHHLAEPLAEAAEILAPLVRPTRSLLTLTDRPSVRLAGLEADERRHDVGS